jgi:hypothetical protein
LEVISMLWFATQPALVPALTWAANSWFLCVTAITVALIPIAVMIFKTITSTAAYRQIRLLRVERKELRLEPA